MHSKGYDSFEIIPLELANTSIAGFFLFTFVMGCMTIFYATGTSTWFNANVPGGEIVVLAVFGWVFAFIPIWRIMSSYERRGRPLARSARMNFRVSEITLRA